MTSTDTKAAVRVDVRMSGFAVVRLAVTTDPGTGTSWYAIDAPRVTGTITVVHDPDRHETVVMPGGAREIRYLPPSPDTGHVHLDYARRPATRRYYSDWQDMPERLTVNGITLTGGTSMTLSRLDEGRLRGGHIACRRRYGPGHSSTAPDRTADRTALIVTAVLTHWRTRPDSEALRLAAARTAAPGYITDRTHAVHDLTTRRDHLNTRIADISGDIAEAQALTHTAPETAPA